MLSTAITLVAGVLGFFRALKARNPFTKLTSLLLVVSSLLPIVPFPLPGSYLSYMLAVASVMAGFEPTNSMRVRSGHKAYFAISGILFSIVALDNTVPWPFPVTLWPFVLVFLGVTGVLLVRHRKEIRTRLAMLVVWSGMGLNSLLSLL